MGLLSNWKGAADFELRLQLAVFSVPEADENSFGVACTSSLYCLCLLAPSSHRKLFTKTPYAVADSPPQGIPSRAENQREDCHVIFLSLGYVR